MKIVISGASGVIGRSLVAVTLGAGHVVTILRRELGNYTELMTLNNSIRFVDVRDETSLRRCFSCADVFLHCGENPNLNMSRADADLNIFASKSLLSLARECCPSLFVVYISSLAAVDRSIADNCVRPLSMSSANYPRSWYGRAKLAVEDFVKLSFERHHLLRVGLLIDEEMRIGSHFSVFARCHLSRRSILGLVDWPGKFGCVSLATLNEIVLNLLSDFRTGISYAVECNRSLLQARPRLFDRQVNVDWLVPPMRTVPWVIPYKLKCLMLGALQVAEEECWPSSVSTIESDFRKVYERERARVCFSLPDGGICLIVGANGGLGQALLARLVKIRRRIVCWDLNVEKRSELSQGCRVDWYSVDVTKRDSVIREIDNLLADNCWVAELYLAAGIGHKAVFVDISEDHWKREIDVNLVSRLALIKYLVPVMRRKQFGRILLVSSSTAFFPLPGMAVYGALNSALVKVGVALSSELLSSGITVSVACPSGMDTGFQQASGVFKSSKQRLLSPGLVASRVLSGMKSNKVMIYCSWITFLVMLLSRCLPITVLSKLFGMAFRKLR